MAGFEGRYRPENERMHDLMFKAHEGIYFTARDSIAEVLSVLHKIEDNPDLRNPARVYIKEFEELRDGLEAVGRHAANLRTRMIRENGCDANHRT